MQFAVFQTASLNNAMRQLGLKERLQPGLSISARVLPPRNPLFPTSANGLADASR